MKKLVILGGGYGGFKILQKLLDSDLSLDTRITLVDRNPYHSLKTEFYSIAAGTTSDKDVRTQFPTYEQVDYAFGEIIQIDTENEQIWLKDSNEPITYDYLVIGLGCEDNYHGIEGAKEYTHSVQSIAKARHASLAIGNLRAYGKVAVVGAGLSGIEVASEIRESRQDLNIRLLDRGDRVLSAFDSKIQEYVEDWFAANDVEVLHNANVDYVEKDAVCNNGACFPNDVTIWTAGVRPHYLVRSLPFEKDEQDKIKLNDYYQVPEQPNVYVVGDSASSKHSPSAQLAIQQAEQIAEVLNSVLNNKEPEIPKELKLKGALGSLGKSDGFGNMFKLPFTGFLPRLAKSGVLWLNKRH
ncbi:NAD(P)/FAD-dependent oxidoreductase [Aquibacillus sp. 3ASR75-11]|uniref:NAD(P)/FAD-dependent oxidoreductase n=1 Tax=Terrihalobacillus insolitus TaxID=2950438 RepID=A0A9X4AL93_9BACI|nr:NAD(P)/FAD-dependent oxidoreductase [Terrihalobacillus insolitus]MDC3414042.1 NAD(P)/FAD-dependent oxidoreductase [Terrihalobacillus insolitus]MDC3424132.1 NAD(P)/FAD-dependent oxidoreductase [Terrihalobacillus insolitus]